MKKRFSSCVAIAALFLLISAGSVFAEDTGNFMTNKVGAGYQGMVAGSFLNGLSARGWIGDRVGLEGSVFYGKADVTAKSGGYTYLDMSGDLWMLEFKAMYAFLVKNYSKFYAGGKIGYGQISVSSYGSNVLDGEGFWTPGVFIGSEWSFPQLPEVGFNFDVGYTGLIFNNTIDGEDIDLSIHGISATFGIHYYF